MPRLCIFCGASTGNDERYATLAREATRCVVRAGFDIVYGGGKIGLMGIVADAALAEGAEVIGVIPESLARAEIAHDGITKLHLTATMHQRKALMAQLSDAFLALPGGFGTMDELHEIVTWRQLGIIDKPAALLNAYGFYDDLRALYARMQRDGFLSDSSRALIDIDEDIAAIAERLRAACV